MDISPASPHDNLRAMLSVTASEPMPAVADYRLAFGILGRGESFPILPADRRRIQTSAAKARCEIYIGDDSVGKLRVWVVEPPRETHDMLPELSALVYQFASVRGGDYTWNGTALMLFDDLRKAGIDIPKPWSVNRKLGRGLSELARQGFVGVSVYEVNRKRGNQYHLDLNALRASQNRPDPEPAVAIPEVAETSAQG